MHTGLFKIPVAFFKHFMYQKQGFRYLFGHFVAWAEKVLDRNEMNE